MIGVGDFMFVFVFISGLCVIVGFGIDDLFVCEVLCDYGCVGWMFVDVVGVKVIGGVFVLLVVVVVVVIGGYSGEVCVVVYVVGIGSVLEVLFKSWFLIL